MDPTERKVNATVPAVPGAASDRAAPAEEPEHFQIVFSYSEE